MSDELKSYMQQALARLNRLSEQAQTKNLPESSQEVQRIRMLVDLIKEQIPNEDTRSSARPAR